MDKRAKKLEFLEEARNSEEHYRATGMHCNHKEMANWLKNLARGCLSEKPQFKSQKQPGF